MLIFADVFSSDDFHLLSCLESPGNVRDSTPRGTRTLRADLRTPRIHHTLSSPSVTLGSISRRNKWSQPAGSGPDGGVQGTGLIGPNDVGPLKTAGVTCANSITAGLQSQTFYLFIFFCSHSFWRHDDNDDEHMSTDYHQVP